MLKISTQPPVFRKSAKMTNSNNRVHKYMGQTEIRAKTRNSCVNKTPQVLNGKTNGAEI